jgi:hypothetical protein
MLKYAQRAMQEGVLAMSSTCMYVRGSVAVQRHLPPLPRNGQGCANTRQDANNNTNDLPSLGTCSGSQQCSTAVREWVQWVLAGEMDPNNPAQPRLCHTVTVPVPACTCLNHAHHPYDPVLLLAGCGALRGQPTFLLRWWCRLLLRLHLHNRRILGQSQTQHCQPPLHHCTQQGPALCAALDSRCHLCASCLSGKACTVSRQQVEETGSGQHQGDDLAITERLPCRVQGKTQLQV